MTEQQTPLDFMLELMHDRNEPARLRLKAARGARPYAVPALRAEIDCCINEPEAADGAGRD
jgi:hypothetical protein